MKWVTSETKSRTRKIKNKIFAIPADAPAIPPNPKAAATRATIKNTRAQYSLVASPFRAANRFAACAAKHNQWGEVPSHLAEAGPSATWNLDLDSAFWRQVRHPPDVPPASKPNPWRWKP